MYQRLEDGQGWVGAPLERTTTGMPLVHDILDRLGVIEQNDQILDDSFEEDFNALRQRFIADHVDFGLNEAPSSSEDAPIPRSTSEPLRSQSALFPISSAPTGVFSDHSYQEPFLQASMSAPVSAGYPSQVQTPDEHSNPSRNPDFRQSGYFIDPSALEGAIELSELPPWPPHSEAG